MKILITGGTGFIGSRLLQLSQKYLKTDDDIILLTSRPVDGFKCVMHNHYTFNKEDFYKAGITHIDAVLHLGHYVYLDYVNIDKPYREDKKDCRDVDSIVNTVHLIDNLPNVPKTFVYSSSCAVYGKHRKDTINEMSSVMPDTIYAAAKLTIEMVLKEWAERNRVNLNILRLAHIYGPEDKRNYSIPIWLQAVFQNRPIQLYANPQMKRNCLYVDDCCKFLLKAIYVRQGIKIFNISSKYTASMMEIAEICKRVSGNPFEINIAQEYEKEELGIGIENSKERFSFLGTEDYSLEDGLKKEFDYYNSLENRRNK